MMKTTTEKALVKDNEIANKSDQAQKLRKIVSRRTSEKDNFSRVITVTSGKGGVGKTNFAVNFALSLAEKGLRVLIIDADFGLSNVDVILGATPAYDLSCVITKSMDIKDVLADGPAGIKFLAGGSGVYDLINLPKSQLVHFVNSILKLEDIADIIIFDTGAGISENIIHLVHSSDDVILVITTEPTSLIDSYAVLKSIDNSVYDLNLKLVVNKVKNEKEGLETAENFSRVVKNFLNYDLESLGYIFSDEVVPKSVRDQVPFILKYPRSVAAKNISDIAMRYVGIFDETTSEAGLKGFITRLIKSMVRT